MKVLNSNTTPSSMTIVQSVGDLEARQQHQSRARVGHFPGANKVMRSGRRFGSWNVGSMTGRSCEIEDMMRRRKLDVLCVQETKWRNTGNRARFLDNRTKAYKMFYYGEQQDRNGVGIILPAELVQNVISVTKTSDRLMSVKLALDAEIWNVVSAYAPQIGCSDSEKEAFWQDLHGHVENIPSGENTWIGADLNGHVGKSNENYEDCHGGYGFGSRNSSGEDILAMCQALDLVVLNTMFIKQDRHLVTYSSGGNETQIDYHLVPSFMKRKVKDCKVILGEPLALQHRLLITVFHRDQQVRPNHQPARVQRISWYNLHKEKGEAFVATMQKHLKDTLVLVKDENTEDLTAQEMWNLVQEPCVEAAKALLGVTSGRRHIRKETWWWRDEAKEVVQQKKKAFQAWSKCPWSNKDEKSKLLKEYKRCKALAKKKCAQLLAAGSAELYEELEAATSNQDMAQTMQGLRGETATSDCTIFKIAAQRRKNSQEISSTKYITDDQGRLLVSEQQILTRWKDYCEKISNEEFPRRYVPVAAPNNEEVPEVSEDEVREAVKRSKSGKAVGPDQIPAEFWKAMGDEGIQFLTLLIQKLLRGDPMPSQWRESYLMPLYKGKGDTRECNNHRSIKFLSQTMKIVEGFMGSRIRGIITLSPNQCGFVGGKSTLDAIQSLRILIEKYRTASRNLHAIFIDFEKAFDRVPRDLIWTALRAKGVPETYVQVIMDMYKDAKTKVKCSSGISEEFPVNVGVHQGGVLSPLLFITVLDYLLEGKVTDPDVADLLFADDGVQLSDDPVRLQRAFDIWVDILEGHGFRMSPTKTEYMFCPFADPSAPSPDIYLNGAVLPKCEKFKYLGSMVNIEATCDDDVNHRVSVGWMKWKQNTGVLCDKRMPLKLKGKLYTQTVRPALSYGSQCWTMLKKHEGKMTATENKMLRMTAGVTKLDMIKSSHIRGSLHVKTSIVDKMEQDRIRWYCHVQRREETNPVKKAIDRDIQRNPMVNTRRGRPKSTWIRQMYEKQHQLGLSNEQIQDRRVCRYILRSQTANPTGGAAANPQSGSRSNNLRRRDAV